MQLILTSDQSHTLYHSELDETYHSKGGAIGESQYVYIDSGLAHVAQTQDTIRIFELGFGTGLNALLTWMFAEIQGKSVLYDTVEKYPLAKPLYSQLNYGSQLGEEAKFQTLHTSTWNEQIIYSPRFTFQKYHLDVFDYAFPSAFYDLIYFDAFAPSKQEEIWAQTLLAKIAQSLKPGGVLVTYCSQGQFKRDLKAIGFELEMLPGPFKKKEITRATRAF
jgi:tRNA U34 5-methylaminomethyl-2-thiouridine-forming methyltransferase MnmC